MSYSFSVHAATKVEALALATQQLDAVIHAQQVHSRDREEALANVRAHLALLGEPAPSEVVYINMHGTICVENPTAGPTRCTNVGSGCSVAVCPAPQE